jgi:hypothetical protein
MHDQTLLIIVLGVVTITTTIQAIGLVGAALALSKGLKSGVEAYRQLRPARAAAASPRAALR